MKYLVIGDACRSGEFVTVGPFLSFPEAACHADATFEHSEDGSFLIVEWHEERGWLSIWQSSVRGYDLVAEQPGAELMRARSGGSDGEQCSQGFQPEQGNGAA